MKKRMGRILSLIIAAAVTSTSFNVNVLADETGKNMAVIQNADTIIDGESGMYSSVSAVANIDDNTVEDINNIENTSEGITSKDNDSDEAKEIEENSLNETDGRETVDKETDAEEVNDNETNIVSGDSDTENTEDSIADADSDSEDVDIENDFLWNEALNEDGLFTPVNENMQFVLEEIDGEIPGIKVIDVDEILAEMEVAGYDLSEAGERLGVEEYIEDTLESKVYDHEWDKYSNNYVYNQLDKSKKAVWEAMDAVCLEALNSSSKSYSGGRMTGVKGTGFSDYMDLFEFLYMYKYCNPQYFFLANGAGFSSSGSSWTIYFYIYSDMQNGAKRAEYAREFLNSINNFKKSISYNSANEASTVKSIHDTVCKFVSYNHPAAEPGYTKEESEYTQSAYSALVKKYTVCAGYALAFELLCNDYGIDCIAVTSESHAYNRVKVNDIWYEIDTTWADQESNGIYYDYYLKSQANYNKEVDHIDENFWKNYVPPCTYDSGSSGWTAKTPTSPSQTTANPVFTVTKSGTSYSVKITSQDSGAKIYYTLNGDTPESSATRSILYRSAFTTTSVNNLRAIAVCNGKWDSEVIKYSAGPVYVIVSYDANGGSCSTLSNQQTVGKVYENLPTPIKTGYTFDGWYTARTGGNLVTASTNVTDESNHTLYAHWRAKVMSVTFNINGGDNVSPSSKTVTYDSTYGTLPIPLRNGYTFEGWYTQASGGRLITSTTKVDAVASHVLYAHWLGKSIKVTLEANGGILDAYEITVNYSNKYANLVNPKKANCDFAGWYYENTFTTRVTADTTVTKSYDHKLYAKWNKKYNANVPQASPVSGTAVKKGSKIVLSSQSDNVRIYYTTNSSIGTSVSKASGKEYVEPIEINAATSIWAIAVRDDLLDSSVATFSYTVIDENSDWGDITEVDRNARRFSGANQVPNEMWVAGIPSRLIYTGKAQTIEELHVYNHKKLLREGVDYSVNYTGNVNAGTATVKVTGKGNYTGTIISTFIIDPLDIAGRISAPDVTLYFNNRVQKATTTVMYRNDDYTYTTLKKGKDYDFVYDEYKDYKSTGQYVVRVVAKGNYKNNVTFKENIIAPDEKIDISKLKYTKIANQSATGSEITPIPVISDKTGYVLRKDIDYTISSYVNNTNIGTAGIIVIGKGAYAGSKIVNFNIVAIPISKAVVAAIPNQPYTGNECRPTVTLEYRPTKNDSFESLIPGTDYKVDYLNNVNAGNGKATVVISGIGRFSGTVKKTFTIEAKDINGLFTGKYTSYNIGEYEYAKSGVKPTVEMSYLSTKLVAGKDYTLTYHNNKAVASYYDYKAPTVIVKGKGNYSGTVTKVFSIAPSKISNAIIQVSDITYSAKAGSCKPKFTVYDADGKTKLAADKDYEKDYRLEYADEAVIQRVYDSKKKLSSSVLVMAGNTVDVANDIIPSGTVIKLTITGKDNYRGRTSSPDKLSATFRYVNYDIAKAKIQVNPQVFSGEGIEVRPDKNDIRITVKYNGLTYDLDKRDYIITGYENNTNKGNGKLTIRGLGNYGGSQTVSFKIGMRTLSDYFNSMW